MIKSKVTPNFKREFPLKNPNFVDLQKRDTPVENCYLILITDN
ncbi:hypothetical protein C789_2142 [Microcystis aeruginosa FACHB-905 = DIANCHI905]|nr:hypothetical protein C789_2142 [Microcystis aeruginosa FACHB-905 = DIANCHI905]